MRTMAPPQKMRLMRIRVTNPRVLLSEKERTSLHRMKAWHLRLAFASVVNLFFEILGGKSKEYYYV